MTDHWYAVKTQLIKQHGAFVVATKVVPFSFRQYYLNVMGYNEHATNVIATDNLIIEGAIITNINEDS